MDERKSSFILMRGRHRREPKAGAGAEAEADDRRVMDGATQPTEYRWLGNHAAVQGRSISLTCDHCRVSWEGCAAECCCPECGAPKGYHDHDADLCYCEQCTSYGSTTAIECTKANLTKIRIDGE